MLLLVFAAWRAKVSELVQRSSLHASLLAMRRRALAASETAEWLNFVANRWWSFSADSIQAAVKRSVDYQLQQRLPPFLHSVQLQRFSLGEQTPCLQELVAFEASEGVPGGRKSAASWLSVTRPPQELYTASRYRLIVEARAQLHCEQFRMEFATRLRNVGVGPSVSFTRLSISGRLQLSVFLDLSARFPHVAKVTAAFKEKPELCFDLRLTRAVSVSYVPLLKQWLQAVVEEAVASSMVDPGQLVLFRQPDALAPAPAGRGADADADGGGCGEGGEADGGVRGVVTVRLRLLPAKVSPAASADAGGGGGGGGGRRICTVGVGSQRHVSPEFPAASVCSVVCSFFVRDLMVDELHVKLKNKSLFGGIHPVARFCTPLKNYNLADGKPVQFEESHSGVQLQLQMEFTSLPPLDLKTLQPDPPHCRSGVLLIRVHAASNLLALDKTGQSDPYCVVFANRRRVGSTCYVKQTRNPKFEAEFHTIVADYSKVTVSFFLYDWDGRNALQDDFLGACHLPLQLDSPALMYQQLKLGFNVTNLGQVSSMDMGFLVASVVFRPVASVAKSESAIGGADIDDSLTEQELQNLQGVDPSPAKHLSSADEGSRREASDDTFSMNVGSLMSKGQGLLEIHVVQARQLMAKDRSGSSDPFVEIRIGSKLLFKSKVVKSSLEPRWDEWITTRCPKEEERLKIDVWDKDMVGKDFLGELSFDLGELRAASAAGASWYSLGGKRVKSGEIQLAFSFAGDGRVGNRQPEPRRSVSLDAIGANSRAERPLEQEVELSIIAASNLMAGGVTGSSDPYVTVALADKVLHKTQVKRSTLNPIWQETVQLRLPPAGQLLRLAIFDKESIGKDGFIGELLLSKDNLLQMCSLKEPSQMKLLGKKVTSGELQLRCRRLDDSQSAAEFADGRSFSENLPQKQETAEATAEAAEAEAEAESDEYLCELLSLIGSEKLTTTEKVYLKVKGDTSSRGVGGQQLHKTRLYSAPGAGRSLPLAESFAAPLRGLASLTLQLKSGARHHCLDACTQPLAEVAGLRGLAWTLTLPDTGVGVTLRLAPRRRSASAASASTEASASLRRRSRRSGFRGQQQQQQQQQLGNSSEV